MAGSGSADKAQVQRMVAAILGLKSLPQPDDAADALAMAICVAHRERPAAPGEAPADREKAAVLDRSSIEPITRGRTPYERAVREALARERPARRGPASRAIDEPGPAVIASVEGLVGAIAADSLVVEVAGIGYRVHAAPAVIARPRRARGSSSTRTTSSATTCRRCTASDRPRSSASSTSSCR